MTEIEFNDMLDTQTISGLWESSTGTMRPRTGKFTAGSTQQNLIDFAESVFDAGKLSRGFKVNLNMKVHEIKTPTIDTSKWRKITSIQKAEYTKREFLGDDYWIKNKQQLDLCMIFRKSVKGKPTEEQLYLLEENKSEIKRLRRMLFGVEFQTA